MDTMTRRIATDDELDLLHELADGVGHVSHEQTVDLIMDLRAERQLNAELARMLKANEWHGGGSDKECPECGGVRGLGDHSPDCALSAILKKAVTE